LPDLSLEVRKYSRKYLQELEVIDKKYRDYKKHPNTHPRMTEEWNAFWMLEFTKLSDNTSPSRTYFDDKWNLFWPKRISEIYDEDILVLRITLRREQNLPINPEEMRVYEEVIMNRKSKITQRCPIVTNNRQGLKTQVKVPSVKTTKSLIDLNELSSEISKKVSHGRRLSPTSVLLSTTESDKCIETKDVFKIQEPLSTGIYARSSFESKLQPSAPASHTSIISLDDVKEKSASVPVNKQEPSLSFISNSDITVLFSNYTNLSQKLQTHLISVMNQIEQTDPDRYQELQNTSISDSNDSKADEEPQPDNKIALVIESDDDDDSALLTAMKSSIAATTIKIFDGSAIEEGETELVIDLTS
jgi:hypothetical protein